ncbi:MAG TPA: amidase family protein [Vicinamibacterales bacterium]
MNICQRPATELAELLRRKSLSAREVVAAHLARIDAVNSKVNAIVTLVAEQAMAEAQLADERLAHGEIVGPLHGLPIAHKDLQETAGIRTTFGSPIFRDYIPAVDSPTVQRLKRAGAITVGKTNTPEFGAGSQTFNPVFGATLNPYDTTKTCGGSSGGAAVALACGMLPIADGTDMGGSLRNPAAFCGVVGIRPTSAPLAGRDDSADEMLSIDGPMARTAADVALLLGAMTSADVPSMDHDHSGVRVAWPEHFGGMPFEPRVRDAVNSQRAHFEAIGCIVADADPDLADADDIFKTLRARAFVTKYAALVRDHRALIKDAILGEVDRGQRLTGDQIDASLRSRAALRHRIADFMRDHEFIVLPTTQVAPFDVNEPFVREIDGVAMDSYIDWMKSCYYISVLGHPAASVPCGTTSDGLPIGLQIVGRRGADWDVLRLAHAFEAARGPFAPPAL